MEVSGALADLGIRLRPSSSAPHARKAATGAGKSMTFLSTNLALASF